MGFLFAYSMREKTHAHRRMQDNVPDDVKQERLVRMINVFKENQLIKQKQEIGAHHLILVDKLGRDVNQLSGLTDTNKRAIIPMSDDYQFGDFVLSKVTDASQNTLFCEPVRKMGISEYFEMYGNDRFII
jgi:tRNA-2-methylthio-N6-dimethylallyladenosine synthase